MPRNRLLILLPSALSLGLAGCATTPPVLAPELADARAAYFEQDHARALTLLRPLAEQGDADAQYALGFLLYNGLGTPQEERVGIEWIRLAAANGSTRAAAALDRLRAVTPTPDATRPPRGDKPTVPTAAAPAPPPPTALAPAVSAATVPPPPPVVPSPYADDRRWLAAQPAGHYTIQLVALPSEAALERYLVTHQPPRPHARLSYRHDGDQIFALVSGSYDGFGAARAALEAMPQRLRAAGAWIRPFADLQRIAQ